MMTSLRILAVAALACLGTASLHADDAKTITSGGLKLAVPEGFEAKQPAVRIIEHEFSAGKADGDEQDGRLTVMVAGGSVQANVDRWAAQFGDAEEPKIEKKKIGDVEVHVVDISGTFSDRRGPFAPAESFENYRMLGAILISDNTQVFLKFTGPKATIARHEEAFTKMVDSVSKR